MHDSPAVSSAERILLQNLLGSAPELRGVLDRLPFPVGVFTLDGRVIFINLPPLSESGQVADNVVGELFWDTSWFNYSEESKNQIRSVLEGAAAGQVVQRELTARFGDTVYRSFEGNFGPLLNSNGDAIGIVGSGMDITNFKGHEQELRKSQLLLEGIVEHLPVMVFVKRASDLRFSLFNRAAEKILGYSREEMLGKGDCDFWPTEQAEFFTTADREVLASPKVKRIDREPIRTATGEIRYLRTWKVALRDASGKPEYLLGISVDITDEVATLEALRLSEEKLRGLYEMAPLGIALTDKSGNYVEFNEAFRKICGYPESELKRLNYWKLTPPEYAESEQAQLESLATVGRYGPYEKEYIQKDGTRIPVRLNGLSVTGTDNQKYVWSIVEDIREQKATERTLRQAQKMEAVGQLTAGIAHDFNNLLTVISGNLELLLADKSATPMLRERAHLALSAAKRGGELTQHLLAYGRKLPLNPTVCELGPCIENSIHWLKRVLPANIEIKTIGIESATWALIDKAQFENGLLNLSLNARDAMPNGGVLTFALETVCTDKETAVYGGNLPIGQHAKITVRDTGSGMPPEVLLQVFDPFFTTKKSGEGSGMGLSMVYGFVRQSGGRIAVTSEVGVGTVFEIYFPLAQPPIKDSTRTHGQKGSPDVGSQRLRLLLVEDLPQVRETVSLQIETLGHDVVSVADGEAALKLLEAEKFDLLITDLGLPGKISGQELCELAIALKPEIKLLTMSGYNEGLIATGQSPNAIRYTHLRKPFELKVLKKHIDSALSI